jgi:hypothetical protein
MMARNPFQGDDVDPFSGVRDEETGETAYKGPSNADIERLEKMAADSETKSPPPKKMSFKQAFADARKSGDKTFMFGGKKYTTELAKPAVAKSATTPKFSKVDPDIGKGPSSKEIDDLERRAAISQVSMAGGKSNFGISQGRQVDPKVLNSMKRAGGMKAGGAVKSASKRADGCAQRGKTKGKMV